jgi:long-chain fatty acid transport protein
MACLPEGAQEAARERAGAETAGPKRLRRLRAAALALAGVLVPAVGGAEAAGFFIQDQGVAGVGRAHAGDAAIAEDASTIFFNPAGLTRLKEAELDFGLNVLMPDTRLGDRGSTAATPGTGGAAVPLAGNDGGNPFSPTPIGHLYLAVPLEDGRTWVGMGVAAPFGLSLRYDPGWFGRYDSTKTVLKTFDIAPTVAYRINRYVSAGAGLDVQYATAKLENAVPNPLAPGGPTAATDGAFRAAADDWSVGFNVGLMITPWSGTRVGLHYRSAMTHDLRGDATVSGLTGPLAGLNATTGVAAELDLPDMAALALAHDLTPDLTVLAHILWFGWDRFDEVRLKFANGSPDVVIPENYEDSWAVAVGAEYAVSAAWRARAGFQYDESPSVTGFRDTRIPDSSRYWLAAGAAYAITANMDLDLSYAHVLFDDTRITLVRKFFDGTAVASAINLDSAVATHVDYVSLALRYRF